MSLFDIEDKTLLITGASSGLGKELAIQCAKLGAKVIITGRDENRLKETFSQSDNIYLPIPADLSFEDDINKLTQQLPILDGVIFCAGVVEYAPVKLINSNRINNTMSINFNSQVLLTQQLIKQRKLNRGSSLVYISSIASKIGVAGTAMYAASKSALNAFVKVTANELSTQSIRANSICPGIILTPMGEKAQSMNEDVGKDYPLGLGTPKDIVGPCVFLLSEASRWVTGTEMILDGGLTLI
jgi:NAD(P)-dependent dehydrogenase (short-subunit alcohol dehydrogenase family)